MKFKTIHEIQKKKKITKLAQTGSLRLDFYIQRSDGPSSSMEAIYYL